MELMVIAVTMAVGSLEIIKNTGKVSTKEVTIKLMKSINNSTD